jgi:hypothetical protein
MAVPQLRRLVTGFPPWWPGFKPRSGHIGLMVNKVALGQVFSEYFSFLFRFLILIPQTAPHLSEAGTIDQ